MGRELPGGWKVGDVHNDMMGDHCDTPSRYPISFAAAVNAFHSGFPGDHMLRIISQGFKPSSLCSSTWAFLRATQLAHFSCSQYFFGSTGSQLQARRNSSILRKIPTAFSLISIRVGWSSGVRVVTMAQMLQSY